MADNKAMLEKRKKETIIDLAKYLDKRVRVKFSGGRESCGILKGWIKFKQENTNQFNILNKILFFLRFRSFIKPGIR